MFKNLEKEFTGLINKPIVIRQKYDIAFGVLTDIEIKDGKVINLHLGYSDGGIKETISYGSVVKAKIIDHGLKDEQKVLDAIYSDIKIK